VDVLVSQDFSSLAGRRIGLITNQTGVTREGRPTAVVFHQTPRLRLVALFAPEHGIEGIIPAGDSVPQRVDRRTGKTVYSLYGKTRQPTPEMLRGLDTLVFDMQDIGSRSYTYISTMGLAMKAAAQAGLEFVVLDRPNPMGGMRVEGPPLDPTFRSFVGQYDIPYLHGLTVGELAQWINQSPWMGTPCRLTVVPMRGWQRTMTWSQTGLKWVPTSPNVPFSRTPIFYATTGWLGETGGMSNGCGTDYPFELAGMSGAPPERYAAAMNALHLQGVSFRPIETRVIRGKYAGETHRAVKIDFTNLPSAHLTALGLQLMETAQRISGRSVFSKSKADDIELFDKVTGGNIVRSWLKARRDSRQLIASWTPFNQRFQQQRRPFLIYPEPASITQTSLATP
jgi:uncharacterized protein YbbC (DUF1343 family)